MIKRLTTSSHDDRLRKAARWYVRHEADAELSPPEWQAWEAWSANSENSAEYDEFVRLRQIASGIDRPALPSLEEVRANFPPRHVSRRPFFGHHRHWLLRAPAAAALAGVVASGLLAVVILSHRLHDGQAAGAATVRPGDAIPFSAMALKDLRASGRPVLVNLGADWCESCKVNDRTLSDQPVRQMMARKHVAYLKGDWSKQELEITSAIQQFGRPGVPLYLLYCPGSNDPTILPQVLTEDSVLSALARLPDQSQPSPSG